MADIKIGDEYRHGADVLEIIHAIGIGDVARTTEDVNDRRVQLLQGRLGDRNARNWIGIGENAAAMDQHGADPGIGRHFERL